jgi:tetratricopeptide (TPR) repeat protein
MAKKKYKSIHSKKAKRKAPVNGSRANKKLIIVLGVVVAVAIAGLGGVLYSNLKSADRNIANADEYMLEGEYRKAYKSYGRAVSKDPTNLAYVKKLQGTFDYMVPITQEEARAFYDSYITTLIHSARYNPFDIDAHLAVANEMYRAARKTGSVNYWKRLRSVAQAGIEKIAPDNPRRHELLLYLGLSSLRIEDDSLTETYDAEGHVRFPGEGELEAVLEADPGNEVAWAGLAHGRMALYYRLDSEGKTKQAIANRQLADETMQKALAVAGDSFDVVSVNFREMLLRRGQLMTRQQVDADSVTQLQLDVAETAVIDAQNRLIEVFDPAEHNLRTAEVTGLLLKSTEDGPSIAIELLQKHIDHFPTDFNRVHLLAAVLKQENRLEEAREIMQLVIDAPQQTVCIESVEQFGLRVPSALFLVELSAGSALEESDEEAKESLIEAAKESRDILADFVSNNASNIPLLYADGIVALAEGNYAVATSKLEKVLYNNPKPSSLQYRYAAIGLAETGSNGLAVDRLAKAIVADPTKLSNYVLKARLELKMKNYDMASRTLSKLPLKAKSVPQVSELLDMIAMGRTSSTESVFTDETLAFIAKAEKLASLGKFEEAIASLQEKIAASASPDWRLYVSMSNLYMNSGDKSEAARFRELAIELKPDSQQLKNELLIILSDGKVEAVIALVNARGLSEEETAEQLAVSLFALGVEQEKAFNRWSRMGNEESANEAKKFSDQAYNESANYQLIAEGFGSQLPQIALLQFNQAILKQDIENASILLEEYSNLSGDAIEIGGMSVSLHLLTAEEARKNGNLDSQLLELDKALVRATKMTEERPFSDLVWSTLGAVYSEMGQEKEALLAYEEAYRISPKSKENIRNYVGSLFATGGDSNRLLRIVRLAHEQFPADKQILGAWIDVETKHGDLSKVLAHSQEQYLLHSDDRKNAIELASFYTNNSPTPSLMLNLNGTKIFQTRVWDQMSPARKKKELIKAKKRWDVLAGEILDKLSTEVDPYIGDCVIHAKVLRDRGRLSEASKVWEDFIASREGTEEYTMSVIAAADFFNRAQLTNQAISVLELARDAQSDKFEIDAALGSIYFISGDATRAAELLEKPTKATGDVILQSKRIEALAISGQFEEAEKALADFSTTNDAFASAMLRATISRVKSSVLLAKGDIKKATTSLAAYRDALQVAITVDPKNLVPYFRLCTSLLNEYRLTQNKALLKEALVIANEGEKQGEELEQFAIVRADVLQADGQLERAIDRLAQYVSENPESDNARQRLIEAYLDGDNKKRAIATAEEGIEVAPENGRWYQTLGDLHLRANDDRGETAKVYLEAIKRNPSVRLLHQINSLMRTEQELPNEELLAMARSETANLHPVATLIEAKALKNLDQRANALSTLKLAWKTYSEAIEKGWIAPLAVNDWFLDLHELFSSNAEEGELFVLELVSGKLSAEEQYGLANYFNAFGIDYIDKVVSVVDSASDAPNISKENRLYLLNLKGAALVEAGRYEESGKVFKQLLEEQNSPMLLNNYAYVIGVYMNRPEEGLELAKQAAEQAPRNSAIIDTVSTLHARVGDNEKAAELLEYLLVIDPSNAKVAARLAMLYAEQLNQPERGIVFAERARSLSPRLPEVLDALGWSYFKAGREEKATEFLQRSLRQGETSSAYVHLAQVLMAGKEYDDALDYLRMAEELAQDDYSKNSISVLKDDIRSIQSK